jgi:hypothetical protein
MVAVVYEPGVGYVNAPGTSIFGREGWAVSHWTTHGARGRRLPDADGQAILAIGDSFTEAAMIPDEDVYPALLETELRKTCPGQVVVNAGRSTWSSADYVALAEHFRKVFKPRHVVVQLRDSDLGSDAWFADRTHFVHSAGSRLAVEAVIPPERAGVAGWLWTARQHSMLLSYGIVRLGEFRQQPEPPLFFAGSVAPAKVVVESDYPLEAALDSLADAYDANLTVLFVPEFDAAQPTVETPSEARILARCRERKIDCVSLRAGYSELARAGRSPFGFANTGYNVGHLNVLGHRLAATLLAKSIAPRLIRRGECR